jgi:glutathione S-transferase
MRAKLYSLSLSHPSHAARLMLERKGIDHDVHDLLPGMHPIQLRLAGFRGGTVPALRIDGRRIQGSLAISHELDAIQAEPALFPADPERRAAVKRAEAWGEREVQPIPRRIFRWAVTRDPDLRRWLAKEAGMPVPRLMAALNIPVARYFARKVDANDAEVRADLAALPATLDRADVLVAEGTIGGEAPNAADYQIGTAIRVLLAFEDLHPVVVNRPSADLALRLLPQYPGPIPPVLPPAWI